MICSGQCKLSGSDVPLSDGIFDCISVKIYGDYGILCDHEVSISLYPG